VAFAATLTVSPPLASTSPPLLSPVTVPPRLKDWAEQTTTALAESAVPIVPLPLVIEQVCPAGWVRTVTA
jgi:hypothetical protein